MGEFEGGTDAQMSFKLSRTYVQPPTDMVHFAFEAYPAPSACPPDPNGKLLSVAVSMPLWSNSIDVKYEFSLLHSGHSVRELGGTILVLRAAESTVGVACTQAVTFTDTQFLGCHTD